MGKTNICFLSTSVRDQQNISAGPVTRPPMDCISFPPPPLMPGRKTRRDRTLFENAATPITAGAEQQDQRNARTNLEQDDLRQRLHKSKTQQKTKQSNYNGPSIDGIFQCPRL